MNFTDSIYCRIQILLRTSLLVAVICGALNCSAQNPSDFVEFTLISDGDPVTSEHGFAVNAMNNVAYITHNLYTVGDQQFATYYGENPDDPGDPFNERIIIARRTLGDSLWEILKTTFTANNIFDTHDNVNFAIDGDGHMHLSWGMHGDTFHYAVSPAPVTGANSLSMGPDLGTITGRENTVTYPQFYNLPNGDLLYSFREGSSGNGDMYLNRFDNATRTWSNVHENASGTNHVTYLQGSGFSPNWNSYLNRMVLDDNLRLHVTWTNRYGNSSPAGENGYQTNNNIFYGYSDDFGLTFNRMDGTPYELPIVDPEVASQVSPGRVADIALAIPEGSSLINQTDMAFDHNNNPMYVTWYAPNASTGDHQRQYMLGFWDGDSWETRQISFRTVDPASIQQNESRVRDLGRPFVLVDNDGRVLVVYRDNQGANGITVVHSRPFSEDPDRMDWFEITLTTENLGTHEPNFDTAIWDSENKLHLLYQRQSGFGNNLNSSDVFVMEWDAAAYFDVLVEPGFVVPDSFNVFRGVLLDGTLAEAQAADDVGIVLNPGFTIAPSEAPVWLEFQGVVDANASYDLHVESKANTPGLTYTVEMRNANTGQYEEIASMPESFNTDSVETYPIIAQQSTLVDDFSGDLSNYTDTVILDNNGGGANSSTWTLSGGALTLVTNSYDGIEQHAFINNGLALEVGQEVQLDVTVPIIGDRNLGLYVGGTAPTTGVRRDYITVYNNTNTQILSRGFDGLTSYPFTSLPAAGADTIFIARTDVNVFETGFYAGGIRTVVTTREPNFPNTANFVGIYADVREAGTLVEVDDLVITSRGLVGASGEVEARIGWRKTGFTINFPWAIELDLIGWQRQ